MKYILLFLACALGAASLFMPMFETKITYLIEKRMYEPGRVYIGWQVLLVGWLGIINGLVAWYANITFWISFWLVWAGKKSALLVSGLSLLIALSGFINPVISNDNVKEYIATYNVGSFCWLASHVILIVVAYLLNEQRNSANQKHQRTP